MKLEDKLHDIWALAKKQEERKLSGERRLRKFPLYKRILFYFRFNKIRAIIAARAMRRSTAVLVALGVARKIRAQKRKLRAIDGGLS